MKEVVIEVDEERGLMVGSTFFALGCPNILIGKEIFERFSFSECCSSS
jgi:hypothetical protein